MSRQPIQVHIFLYKKINSIYEFAVFQRADNNLWWQGVCGGAEQGETIETAAKRELFEETGIAGDLPLYRLDTLSYLPVDIFSSKTQAIWGNDTVVVPMYFFAVPYGGHIELSDEHTEFRWLQYEEAVNLIYFQDQKTALWELKERLLRGNLIR